ncbi:MAG: phosphoenolpyruvate--protein phosphotransferase [Gammaproteobacteria bacterium]|nr:phosphoenolpyruvate--protein phosphotransferase [Gammaproteobacteria bacterium]
MALQLSGISVSRGIAIGDALVLQRDELEVLEYAIPEQHINNEIHRFKQAAITAKNQLNSIRQKIIDQKNAEVIAFIDAHILMISDSTLINTTEDIIKQRRCNAEWALQIQGNNLAQVFEEMDDIYLCKRKDDIHHVVKRIQRVLVNRDTPQQDEDVKGRILLADDLTPADTILMQHQGIIGFITESGGPLSHTAIIARSLGIPAIVGIKNARHYIKDNDTIIIDGQQGVLIADIDDTIKHFYHKRQKELIQYKKNLQQIKKQPAITRDGQVIHLQTNIELAEDVKTIHKVMAEGVGLYRTEFLYMNRDDIPDEEEQLSQYRKVIRSLKGLPLTIRTLDLGADKNVENTQISDKISPNPALGLRAIRLCLNNPSLFKPQLRAIMRASAYGPVRLMIPMLSNIHEVQQVRELIRETQRELENMGIGFDPHMAIGGMIETPAAAISAHMFAQQLDFLSIGTNDLIQYTLAIDRIDDEVNYLYDPLHPAVLELIHRTISAGKKTKTNVALCGEMAGNPHYTRLLLGLGLTHFSMPASSLLEVKAIINKSDTEHLSKLTRKLLRSNNQDRINALLEEILNNE